MQVTIMKEKKINKHAIIIIIIPTIIII